MSEPIESVVKVASSPAQAKIFAATLIAAGIPARIEGDNLTDEWAASQRALNLIGTRVMVPTKSLARAREILQPADIDPAELEREALAAAPPAALRTAPVADARTKPQATSLTGPLLLLTTGAAVLFAFLWQKQANAAQTHPDFDYAWKDGVLRETLRRDGWLSRQLHDHDGDGRYERIETFDRTGNRVVTYDQLEDGIYQRAVETRSGDLTVTWSDDDRDGLLDVAVVSDRDGKPVQRLEWRAGAGFVVTPAK